jgi:hypothetical protein
MTARPTTVKVDASSVQGEGAYIVWKRLTWGERRDYIKAYNALPEEERASSSRQFLFDHLSSWNWVDAKNRRMPLPTTEDDEKALYDEEVDFLYKVCSDALTGKLAMTEADLKN